MSDKVTSLQMRVIKLEKRIAELEKELTEAIEIIEYSKVVFKKVYLKL